MILSTVLILGIFLISSCKIEEPIGDKRDSTSCKSVAKCSGGSTLVSNNCQAKSGGCVGTYTCRKFPGGKVYREEVEYTCFDA